MDQVTTDIEQERGASSASIGLIAREHIPLFWPGIAQLLQEQEPVWLEKIQPHEVYGHLISGNWDVWSGLRNGTLDGIVIAQWDRFERVHNYKIMVVVGHRLKQYLRPGLEKIERYVLKCGGTALDIEVLPRMEKMFHKLGYKSEAVVMRRNVVKRWGN